MDTKKFGKKSWPFLVIVGLWLIFNVPYLFRGLVPFPSRYLVSFGDDGNTISVFEEDLSIVSV